eukprot:774316-Pyramimonas_sp.AAC.1
MAGDRKRQTPWDISTIWVRIPECPSLLGCPNAPEVWINDVPTYCSLDHQKEYRVPRKFRNLGVFTCRALGGDTRST